MEHSWTFRRHCKCRMYAYVWCVCVWQKQLPAVVAIVCCCCLHVYLLFFPQHSGQTTHI